MFYMDIGCLLIIGKDVMIGYMVMFYGCMIGDELLIGIGVMVFNCVVIGKNCIIGVYVLILEGKVIFDNFFVMGVFGKVVKEISVL